MIRLFTALCKSLLKKISEDDAFYESINDSDLYRTACPHCGTAGKYSEYGSYVRNHVSCVEYKIIEAHVRPSRVKCLSCNRTHALLPDTLTPYSPYTLCFKLLVLTAYYGRDTNVIDICDRFGIAVSTLYEWKKVMTTHKDFMLGVLISRKIPALEFLRNLLGAADISDILRIFFNKYGLSFMQDASVSVTLSGLP